MGRIELAGSKIGRLTVLWEVESARYPSGKPKRRYECECECGRRSVVLLSHLRSGHTQSCGCLATERRTEAQLKHGHARGGLSPTYISWKNMLQRCYSVRHPHYKNYGGRGITICNRWRESFETFLADMGERPKGLTLERVNNDGNYEPGNCIWATYTKQSNNRRSLIRIKHKDRVYTSMSQCAKACGINYQQFRNYYIRRGFSVDMIMQIFHGPPMSKEQKRQQGIRRPEHIPV